MSSTNVRPLAYSVPEAAQMAAVSRAHLYRAMHVGDLPSVKTGSRRVILHDDLIAWLRGQREDAVGFDETASDDGDAPEDPSVNVADLTDADKATAMRSRPKSRSSRSDGRSQLSLLSEG